MWSKISCASPQSNFVCLFVADEERLHDEEAEELLAFARVFSGTLRPGQEVGGSPVFTYRLEALLCVYWRPYLRAGYWFSRFILCLTKRIYSSVFFLCFITFPKCPTVEIKMYSISPSALARFLNIPDRENTSKKKLLSPKCLVLFYIMITSWATRTLTL